MSTSDSTEALPRHNRWAYGPGVRFLILGPLEVSGEDGPIVLGGPRQRLVLAHLLVRPNQVVQADVLVDLVWGEDVPSSVRNTLQSYVSRLRGVLGQDRLEGRAGGYTLRVDPGEIDAMLFESLLQEARAVDGHPERVSQILGEALALWRGPAFADLASDGLAGEVARLEELRILATEERIAADLELGRHAALVGELEALTRTWPLRERLWGLLMLALYRANRQADALAAFDRARQLLADELGVDPSAELQRVHGRILRHDPELDVQGQPLRGYRLLEKLGEGAFGEVYRAIQPQVGREVAVKVVHPELANQPDFVRRFEREAQLVARLEHPHVVPLYDYWREPDGAYLVMRYLRGGSVEALLEGGPVDVERATAILDDVAAALSAAHRQGVVHRDVKPGNVLLDEEHNAYLTDFGVALDAGAPEQTAGTMVRGTPAYLSPEQIRLEPATPRSDIYALGVVLYELLAGGHPFPDSSLAELFDRHLYRPLPSVREGRPELPPAVDAVISRATAKDPSIRFSDATEMAAAFRVAIEGREARITAAALRNPFKGLRAFLEADAGDFFGREALVRRLIERLAEPYASARFLCVVGPSGSGKSSLVRAGVVPALRRGAIEGSQRWYVVDLVPGPYPLRALETALLGVAVEPPPSLLDDLERDELGLIHAVERILPDPDAELLIVIDQLEEVFTLTEDEDERARFLGAIVAAVGAHGSRVRVIATLRADFFDRPLSVRGFGDLLAARSEAITPMSPEELERAISGPAERVGLEIEPGLVAAMVADVVDRPGALPLLQYALTELAERATDGRLTMDAYREIGRVSGALGRRAEQLFEPLNEAGRDACLQLFLRLVTLGEGSEDTRRRVRRSEVRSLAEERSMDGVIETFGRHRLLSFDRDAETREPTVEIAHEALLREWGRFRTWIEEAREDLRLSARISNSAAEWMHTDRSAEYLLSGTRLAQAEEATQHGAIRLTETEREYVEASVARRESERADERTRRDHELRLERRARTRLRGLVAALTAGLLVAASLTVLAVNRSREAQRLRDEATVLGLTGAVLSNLRTDPQLSLLLALHAVNLSSELGEPVPAETVEALHWAIQEAAVQYPVADGRVVASTGPLGLRGLLDLPVAELANHALEHVDGQLNDDTCMRFFGTSTCPSLPDRFSPDLTSRPLRTASTNEPLAGTSVSITGVEDAGFVRELELIRAETGIDVQVVATTEDYFAQLETEPPDIAIVSSPRWIRDLAGAGRLMDLGGYLDMEQVRSDFSPSILSMGTVAPDGSSPSESGTLYGAPVAFNVKSLIWYPVPEFRQAGYEIPETWDELVRLTDQIVDDGRTPWCMGLESGFAAGWPATDWVENLLLGDTGPALYDDWTSHRIPFDHPAVRLAFERFGQIVFGERNLSLGTAGAVVTPFEIAQLPMIETDPPGCWLYHFPSFAASNQPRGSVGTITDAFPFPSPNARHRDTLLVGGGMVMALADRPEVREVMRSLVAPEFGEDWFTSEEGGFSANRRFDMSAYAPAWRRQAEALQAALDAGTFRFDGSDLMPPEVGSDVFWDAMIRYVSQGPDSLDAILHDLEAAWPDDG